MQKFNRHFQFKPLSFSIIVIPTSANNIFNFYFEKYFPNPNMSFTNHLSWKFELDRYNFKYVELLLTIFKY